jgi:HNH endonuclease
VAVAEWFLAGKCAGADDAEMYQVVVHVGTGAIGPAEPAGVSAETPAPPSPDAHAVGHPADPARCHVEDGPAISVSTAQMIACTATLSWMQHNEAGQILALGRRRRRPNAALRRAARERDKCRCRFPGCESRRVDLHHIVHWIHGGRTDLDNLISLCPYHHKLIHDHGYLIALQPDGTVTFYRAEGTALPNSPPLPAPDGTIGSTHDAHITAETIIPPWYGERLDLDHAIYVCLTNAKNQQDRQEQRDQSAEPASRHRVQVYEPQGWADRIRQYYDEHPARPPGPVLIPTQV